MATSMRDSGIYRSTDSLKNFKIRLKIEKCPSDYHSTPVAGNQGALEMQEFSCLGSLRTSKLELVEDRVFKWQEKIFNDNEIEKYSKSEMCKTPLEKKYNLCLQNLENRLTSQKVLFTYVDEDEPVIHSVSITKPIQCSTSLNENVNELRNRKCRNIAKTSCVMEKKNIINKCPTVFQQKQNHCSLACVQTMHIAALIKEENSDLTATFHEIILVTITVDTNGVITIKPDFSYSGKPYRVEIGCSKTIYYYTVELASKEMSYLEKDPETILALSYPLSTISKPLNYEFQMADPELFRLHILGEIISAQHFEYDGLSINFFLDLPSLWKTEENAQLFQVTQTCKLRSISNTEVAHFCYPFEFEAYCPINYLTKENTGHLPKWPTICFQVISRDSWQRFRTEGYGYMNIPFTPGSYCPKVQTWRPIISSLNSQLRRLFIGGSPELTDLSQVGIPSTTDSCHLSRYGIKTESSGVIQVRLHTVQQYNKSSIEIDKYYLAATGTTRFSTLQKDVAEVIEAFHRARQRMLKAREKIQL